MLIFELLPGVSGPLVFRNIGEMNVCAIKKSDTIETIQKVYSFVGHALFSFGGPLLVLLTANIVFIKSLMARKKREAAKQPTTNANTDVQAQRLSSKLRNERNYVIIMVVLTCSFSFFLVIGISANYIRYQLHYSPLVYYFR